MKDPYIEITFIKEKKSKTIEVASIETAKTIIELQKHNGWKYIKMQLCASFDKFQNKQL